MILSLQEEQYLASLSQKEMDTYHIAKTILGSSFSLIKSRGFIQWSQEKNQEKTQMQDQTQMQENTKEGQK